MVEHALLVIQLELQVPEFLVTLLNALEKRALRKGVAAICLGGGEGLAIAIERP